MRAMPKAVAALLLTLAVVAAAVLALFFLAQRSLIYFPQYTRVDAAATDFALERDDVVLRGWVVNAGAGAPILYFGGNAESVEANRADFARWFPQCTIYLTAYRGYGASDGTPSQDALFADALALYDEVAARHAGQPVAVIGRSLGSGVASYLASQRPVARLALVTPFDSMAAVGSAHYPWLPVRWLLRDRYDSQRHVARHRGPVMVIRAGRDQVVPPNNTARLVAALPPDARVVVLDDADHNTIDADPRYGRALADFMQ